LEKIRNLSSLSRLQQERVDITLSGRTTACGSIHPITQMMRNVLNIFSEMGFEVYEGPEIETDFYNFFEVIFLWRLLKIMI